jgi:hypothetical protein
VAVVTLFGATALQLTTVEPGGAASTIPPGTVANPSPLSATPPAGAVPIPVGANARTLVAKEPPGTSFLITTGTHLLFTVVPQADDHFYAQPGAVLDGAHLAVTAFKPPHGGSADGVEVIGASEADPMVIEDYGTSTHSQTAAVQTFSQSPAPGVYSSGWWLQWLDITGNASRGVSVSDDMVVLQCHVDSNTRLGIGGGGNGVTVDESDVSDNGITVADKGWEAGGIKTVADNVLLENNTIDGNGAPGIWTDSGATDIMALSNHLADNTYGIRVEISNGVSLTGNSIIGSTQQSILVIASENVTVAANRLDDNFGGIIVGGVGRYNKTGIHLTRVTVNHNRIVNSGATGIHQVPLPGTVIKFDYDTYIGGHLQWFGHHITFAQLQALGQERHGTWQR